MTPPISSDRYMRMAEHEFEKLLAEPLKRELAARSPMSASTAKRLPSRAYWRWKSRKRPGRPGIDRELRDLIRWMCQENPLWHPRIHGELLMLGFEVAQSAVSKYMVRGPRGPSQSWKTFLRNHADAAYYNQTRPHRSLRKDAPMRRAIQAVR